LTKDTINNNKLKILDQNKGARQEIKVQQMKIKETIDSNKKKFASEKFKAAQDLYMMKKRAKEMRYEDLHHFNNSTVKQYNQRIQETMKEAEQVNFLTKQLEQ